MAHLFARAFAPALVLAFFAASVPAFAQAPQPEQTEASERPSGLESITVTARKQEENQQSVPVAISTLTGDDFNNQTMQLVEDIQFQTPGLTIRQTVGRKHILFAAIRGFFEADSLITTDPAIGFYFDDVYSARISGVNLSMFDVERIEVLKGPQGVLFGKNNIGGAIKVHSKRPDGEFGGFGRVRLGNFNQTDFEGAVSFPIIDETLSGRLSFLSYHRDGVFEHKPWPGCSGACGVAAPPNNIDDQYENNAIGGRASFVFTPNDRWEFLGQFQKLKIREPDSNPAIASQWDPGAFINTASAAGLFGVPVGSLPLNEILAVVEQNEPHDGFTSFEGRVDIDFQSFTFVSTGNYDDFTVKLISGWRDFVTRELRDQDGTPWVIRHTQSTTKSKQFTQELQVSGQLMDGRLTYTTGAFWGNERTGFNEGAFTFLRPQPAGPPPDPSDTVAIARGYGIYLHGDYDVTERLGVWAGIRTSYDYREMDRLLSTLAGNAISADQRYDAVTWGLGVDFQLNDDVFVYAKADKGFRAGGVNGRGSQALFDAGGLTFDPEFLTMYEIGIKAETFDNRLRTNLATYFGKFKEIQTTIFLPVQGTSITQRGNSGTADVSGAELDIQAVPFPGLLIRGGGAVNWFRFTKGPLADGPPDAVNRLGGRQDRGTPVLQLNLSVRYDFGVFDTPMLGELGPSVQVDYGWRSKTKSESQACQPAGGVVHPCSFPRSAVDTGSYGILNGRIGFDVPALNAEIAFWGRNLLDREYEVFNTNFNTTGFLGFVSTNFGEPRRYGVDITYRFGAEAN